MAGGIEFGWRDARHCVSIESDTSTTKMMSAWTSWHGVLVGVVVVVGVVLVVGVDVGVVVVPVVVPCTPCVLHNLLSLNNQSE